MTADGSIAEQGTLEQLKASEGYVAMLEAEYKAEKSKEDDIKQENPANAVHATVIEEEKEKLDQEENTELHIAQEDLARQSGDLSLYWYYLRSVHWASSAVWATAYILYGVAIKLGEYVVNLWSEATEEQGNGVNGLYLGVYGMLTMVTMVCIVGGGYDYILHFAPRSAKTLHARLLATVLNAPLSFFTSVDIGTTTNR